MCRVILTCFVAALLLCCSRASATNDAVIPDLPEDIVRDILGWCGRLDLRRLLVLSKGWHRLVQDVFDRRPDKTLDTDQCRQLGTAIKSGNEQEIRQTLGRDLWSNLSSLELIDPTPSNAGIMRLLIIHMGRISTLLSLQKARLWVYKVLAVAQDVPLTRYILSHPSTEPATLLSTCIEHSTAPFVKELIALPRIAESINGYECVFVEHIKDLEVFKALFDAETSLVDPDMPGGSVPAWRAVMGNIAEPEDLVRYLMAREADPKHPKAYCNNDLLECYVDRAARLDRDIDMDLVIELAIAGADLVNSRRWDGITPLMKLLRDHRDTNQLCQLVGFILEACPRARMNAADAKGNTLLHYAGMKGGHDTVIALLIENGAIPMTLNKAGHLPNLPSSIYDIESLHQEDKEAGSNCPPMKPSHQGDDNEGS